MKRAVKIGIYAFAGLAALSAVLLVAGFVVIRSEWFREGVRKRAVHEIENATGGRVELAGLNVNARTLNIRVRGLAIHGTEGPDQAPLFRAESIDVGLKIVSVLKKQIDLASLTVTSPRVNLIFYEDGRTNLPTPKAASGRDPIQTVLDLAIKRFRILDGEVQAQARRVALDFEGEELRAQIFYEPEPARYRGEVRFGSLDVTPGTGPALPFALDARFTLAGDHLDITAVHVAFRQSRLEMNGRLESFSSPRAELAYQGRLHLEDAAALAGAALPVHGLLDLEGRAELSGAKEYALKGQLRGAGLAFRQAGVHIGNIAIVSEFAVTPETIELPRFTAAALGGRATGSAALAGFERFRVDVELAGLSLHELTHFEGIPHTADWNGTISGPVHIAGTVRNGTVPDLEARARLAVAPAPGDNPIEGLIEVAHDGASGLISLGQSRLETRRSRVQFSGVLGRRLEVAFHSTGLSDLDPALALFGLTEPLPVTLEDGQATFRGAVTGPLQDPGLRGHISVRAFLVEGHRIDRFDAEVTASKSSLVAQDVRAAKVGMRLAGAVRIGLRNWKPDPKEPLSGELTVRAPDVAVLAAETGVSLPVSGGDLVASVALSGTTGAPQASGRLQARNLVVYDQAVEAIEAQARYAGSLVQVTSAQVWLGGGQLQLSGSYEPSGNDWGKGRLRLEAKGKGVALGGLEAVKERNPGVQGRLETQFAGDVWLEDSGLRPGAVNGWLAVRGLALDREPLGSLLLTAATKDKLLELKLEGELAGSKLKGHSDWALEGEYPASGQIEFTPLRFSSLLAHFGNRDGKPPFEGFASGRVELAGSPLDFQSWKALFELGTFEIRPSPGAVAVPNANDLVLRNDGPVLIEADSRSARVRQAQFRGKDTDLRASGRVTFGVRNPWDLRVQGGVNLALLRNFDQRIYSSGNVAMDVTVRGALQRPDVYGRVDLKKASLNFAGFPNGIDNAEGLIFLYRDRATIENLTAESGGGKLSVTGFVGFGTATTFNVQTKATGVRVRYPEGVSSTLDASLNLTGTLERSLLSGDVVVNRVGFNPRSDLASMLARGTGPVAAPRSSDPLSRNLQLDIHIVTSPQVRFETQLTKDVQGEADLRLRGDPVRPVLLGRVLVSQGEVIFFGNRYTINSGQVLFVNPSKIEPIVNLDLETRARGVDVSLHVTGPADKLNVNYRSDPPLPFTDVVALLATGRAPSGVAAGLGGSSGQSAENWEQRGASALVSHAIANPVAGRLQRFFGVSRLKIDPQITGVTTSSATARLTLEQQVAPNLTFTYITDLSRAQDQTIRVEWDFSRNWSGVALREENGLFGIDFLYKKQFK